MRHFYNQILNLFLILFTVNSLNALPQKTTIEEILKKPYSYEGDNVVVKGLVIQYVVDPGQTSYYLLKGDFGGIIKINTADIAPETNVKYIVTGIVYIDRKYKIPFISEKSRVKLSASPDSTLIAKNGEQNYILYIILATLAFILIGFIYFQMRKKNEQKILRYSKTETPLNDKEEKLETTKFTTDEEFKTIRIVKSTPKTLKFIPGKLVIVEGEDKGKEIRIAGYPTSEGSIVSIGRKEVTGEKAYAHILLKDPTVSREQAILIYRDDKLYVRNLSETNYTSVDGEDLKPGQMKEILPGSVIKVGRVEFKYVV